MAAYWLLVELNMDSVPDDLDSPPSGCAFGRVRDPLSDRVDVELLVIGNTLPPTRLLIPPPHTPTFPRLLTLSPTPCATAAWCSSPPSTISYGARSRWGASTFYRLAGAVDGKRAQAKRKKRFPGIVYPREQKLTCFVPQTRRRSTRRTRSPSPLPHTTPTLTSSSSSTFPPEFFALAQYSHPSEATPPHPRAESSSSPPSRCRALVVPSASHNVVERAVLRVAADAEPQRCGYFLHRDSRPVVHVSRATTTRPAITTATATARCAWGDDEEIMKVERGRGSRLEANISLCSCAGLLLRFDFLSHVHHLELHPSCSVPDPPPPSLEDA
ncbi:hypothetical protein C8R45DRAFT_1224515 [Mycena sanguinolenta]|nr:hypothetical protein C8R45DRAFT_1224515 [Mycena sanguinolenta]